MAERSPVTGAVTTTEAPARYAFPGEELAERSERAAEKDEGKRAPSALAGKRSRASANRSLFRIPI
jgi:hypothetical protein